MAGAVVLALAAAGTGLAVTGAAGDGAASPGPAAAVPPATAPIERGDLVDTKTVDGALTYADDADRWRPRPPAR